MTARQDRIAGAILLMLAVGVFLEALNLELSTDIGPGPGFFPVGLSLSLAALSVLLISQSLLKLRRTNGEGIPAMNVLAKIGTIFAAMLGTVLLMPALGFLLSGAMFLLFLMTAVEGIPIIRSVALAVGIALGFHLIFVIGLNVKLPVGMLGI